MSAPKTDWLALAASICHEPTKLTAEETRLAEREERQRFADPEPEETEEAHMRAAIYENATAPCLALDP